MKNYIIISLLVFVSPVFSQDKIAKIYFSGLKKTKPGYLQNFIHSEEGATLDSLQLISDVQNLRNLQLFSDVSYVVRDTVAGKIVVYDCQELVTVLPTGNFGGISNNFWFQVGANDFNWLGQGYTLGGYYRYYDRHSFEVYQKIPYLFGTRWGVSTNIGRLSNIEPTEINGQGVEFNVDRWSLITLGRYEFTQNLFLEIGGGYLFERYEKNVERSGNEAPGPPLQKFNKFLLKSLLTRNNINYFFHYLSGHANELTIEAVVTKGEDYIFWKILNVWKKFLRLGNRGNFAIRARTGISSNNDTPYAPFVLDNYITVRGSGNRISRGTAEFTVNAEHRHTLIQKQWGAIQVVSFMDWSAWRPPGGSFSGMFEKENNVTFAGVGLRIYFRKIYNLILRLDYGLSFTDTNQHGIVLGSGQYF